MVGGLGWTEILIIGAVVLLFLGGGKKLPEFARSLGEALNEFKDARSGDDKEKSDKTNTEDEEKEETT